MVDSLEAAAAAAPPAGPREKMQHDGKEYDYVFRIDVKDDEPPLPLPFNLSGAFCALSCVHATVPLYSSVT